MGMMQTMSFESQRGRVGVQTPTQDERHRDRSVVERAPRARFVPAQRLVEALADIPPIDFEKLRADIYESVDPRPRNWFED